MTRDQKIVATGAGSGVVTIVVAMIALYHVLPADPSLTDVASRRGYALQLDAFAALPLFLAIVTVGNNRFASEAIDPTLHKEDPKTLVNGRVADNSLQQYVLFLTATCALSVNLAATEMRAIAAAAIIFFVARFAFWIGYHIHPLYRAFGMAAIAYLNLGLLGFALWRAIAAHF